MMDRNSILGWVAIVAMTLLAACSSEPIGPDESLLYGQWVQEGPAQTDPQLTVEQAVIEYSPDGTSTFDAIMTLTHNQGIPERFSIKADVEWTLEETVLTRTLRDVTVTPDIATPQAEELATFLEQEYRASPPGRLIIESVDETRLVLIDGDTAQMLSYAKQLQE